jgi:hypothetical protein
MPAVITEPTPTLTCICGVRRDFGTRVGLPALGMESFCPGGDEPCGKIWRLVSRSTDPLTRVESWVWADFPAESKDADVKAEANALARALLDIDATLSVLAVFNGPVRGLA